MNKLCTTFFFLILAGFSSVYGQSMLTITAPTTFLPDQIIMNTGVRALFLRNCALYYVVNNVVIGTTALTSIKGTNKDLPRCTLKIAPNGEMTITTQQEITYPVILNTLKGVCDYNAAATLLQIDQEGRLFSKVRSASGGDPKDCWEMFIHMMDGLVAVW